MKPIHERLREHYEMKANLEMICGIAILSLFVFMLVFYGAAANLDIVTRLYVQGLVSP